MDQPQSHQLPDWSDVTGTCFGEDVVVEAMVPPAGGSPYDLHQSCDRDNEALESHSNDSLIALESVDSDREYADRLRIETAFSPESSLVSHDEDTSRQIAASDVPAASASPRFHFWNDAKTAQDWTQLQESSVQRQRDFQDSIHCLTRRMSGFTGQLAMERLERDKALQALAEQSHVQLEEALDRITLKQDLAPESAAAELDRRVTKLDTIMTQSLYVSLYDQVQGKLGILQDHVDAITQVQRDLAERSRQDSMLFREVDSLAGSMARRYQEERACRLAAIELAGYQIQEQEFQPDDVQQFIDAIRELRKHVAFERRERLKCDAALKEKIQKDSNSLKRTLLLFVGGDPEPESSGGTADDSQHMVVKE